jgi:hypothetical protein
MASATSTKAAIEASVVKRGKYAISYFALVAGRQSVVPVDPLVQLGDHDRVSWVGVGSRARLFPERRHSEQPRSPPSEQMQPTTLAELTAAA